jgi:hypothetical protein
MAVRKKKKKFVKIKVKIPKQYVRVVETDRMNVQVESPPL